MTPEEIIEQADPEAIVWDGFNGAIIGTDYGGRIVYDVDLMIAILVTEENMEEIDAIEHLNFNVLCAYVGEMTPIHIYRYDNLDDN